MKRRLTRSLGALLAGLALSLWVAEPAVAGTIPGPEIVFTGELLSRDLTHHYCGAGQSQIGDLYEQGRGTAYTRPVLFYGLCAVGFPTTLPPGFLGANVDMLRNGSICGTTAYRFNRTTTALFGIGGSPCTNLAGWQEWRTIGGHTIKDERTNDVKFGTTISPWQLY